ncbi:MAG: acetylxylan esterase [Nanoarchaeota archaeon]
MRIRKRTLRHAIIVLILLIIVVVTRPKPELYSYSEGKFSVLQDRGKPAYQLGHAVEENGVLRYAISYKSLPFKDQETTIHGFFFIPKNAKDVPGLVLLPGGGVGKEAEASLASKIASWGYGVLTVDQRGIGQTGGTYLSGESDFRAFQEGHIPIQHLSVIDGLIGTDVIREMDGVDGKQIAMAGESMGGRYALIAGALDDRLRGVVTFGASGFHSQLSSFPDIADYLTSIDPDQYIRLIAPRPVVMFQGSKDDVVSMDDARLTFGFAADPKEFIVAECGHGYCGEMDGELQNALSGLFQ